jgi:hypothetical protein
MIWPAKIGANAAALCLLLCLAPGAAWADDTLQSALRVPAFTAYSEPEPEALEFSERNGVTGWTDDKNRIVWYGRLNVTGRLETAVALRLPAGEHVKLRLTVAGKAVTAEAQGGDGTQPITVPFSAVEITAPGYYRFALEGLQKDGKTYGAPEALLLDGPAAVEAHFNLLERRNAASVHLGYPLPNDAKVAWFYNEVTVRTEPVWSYYMACGFRRGYFGIQVNSPTERRIIFSVWDSGNEAVDRSKVAADDRVQLMGKGEGVVADSFGNEGTGGHSHLVYPWKAGVTYRFLVSAQPDGSHTTYSGYFYFPERKRWELIASFRAPKDGDTLRGLYSFNENFGGANGQLRRLAEFGNQWIKTQEGQWIELTTARFTHDPTGKESRKDYGAGVTHGRFYLSNGGFIAEPIQFGDQIHRPATRKPPTDIILPAA